jgi:hypothetical protein
MPPPPAPLRPKTAQSAPAQRLWLTEALEPILSTETFSHFERAVPLNLKVDVSRGNGRILPRYGGERRPLCEVSGLARLFSFPG